MNKRLKIVVSILLIYVGSMLMIHTFRGDSKPPPTLPPYEESRSDIIKTHSLADYYDRVSDSVVQIYPDPIKKNRTGSGVYIAENIIVTNSHVIRGVKGIEKVLVQSNQGEFEGVVIENIPKMDLALVYTHANKGVPASLGDSNTIRIGDRAYTIGASAGYYSTFGVGYISNIRAPAARGRELFIMVEAGITYGNSGGGMFDAEGNLMGIPSFMLITPGKSMGFCIPVNTVKRMFKSYLKEK